MRQICARHYADARTCRASAFGIVVTVDLNRISDAQVDIWRKSAKRKLFPAGVGGCRTRKFYGPDEILPCRGKGAERQRYDDNLIDYIDRVRDPVRFEIDIPNDWKDLQCRDFDNSIPFLSPRNLILFISILVFAALGFICIRLIKATS